MVPGIHAYSPLPPHTAAAVQGSLLSTRFTMAERIGKYGGTPRDLPTSDLPTYGDVARCFYKVFESERKTVAQVNLVRDQLQNSWKSCCPELPLLPVKSVTMKLERFCDKLKKINRSKQSSEFKAEMENLREKLLDISACSCALPKVACNHNRVQCQTPNCVEEHILCDCPPDKRVPVAERSYLSDQRCKVGTHGGVVRRRVANFAFVREHIRYFRKNDFSSHMILYFDFIFTNINNLYDISPATLPALTSRMLISSLQIGINNPSDIY